MVRIKCVTSNPEKVIYKNTQQKGLTKLMFAAIARLSTHLLIHRELIFQRAKQLGVPRLKDIYEWQVRSVAIQLAVHLV